MEQYIPYSFTYDWAPTVLQMILKLPQGHEDSEYVLTFEMGQREGSFYSRRTDIHTEPPSIVLVYRFVQYKFRNIFTTFTPVSELLPITIAATSVTVHTTHREILLNQTEIRLY